MAKLDPNQRSIASRSTVALDDLSEYFGIGTNLLGQVDSTAEILTNEILGGILSPQETIPTTAAVLEAAKDNTVLQNSGLLISTGDAALGGQYKSTGIVHEKFGSPSYQGHKSPKGGCYSSQDFLPTPEDDADEAVQTTVNVYQVFSTTQTPSILGTDISSFLMNCVPSIEWARSVPYLEVVALGDSGADPIYLRHFKNDGAARQFLTTDGPDLGKFLQSTDDQEVVGAMDVFTMPQTFVNAAGDGLGDATTGNYKGSLRLGGDPFRPMMSVDMFTCSKFGALKVDAAAAKIVGNNFTAALKVRIHSKEGLNFFRDYIQPNPSSGGPRLQITFGWSHPDGSVNERPSDANVSARYGDIINACKVAGIYSIKDSRFTFMEGQEVQVDIDLTPVAQGEIRNQLFTSAAGLLSGQDSKDQLESFIKGAIRADNKDVWSVSGKQIVAKLSGRAGQSLSAPVKKAIKEYLKLAKETAKKKRKGEVVEQDNSKLEELMKQIFDNPKAVAEGKRRRPSQVADLILGDMKKKPDPFLRPRFSKGKHNCGISKASGKSFNGSGYISLGKIVTYFLGSIMRDLDTHEEAQLVFYGFNHNAGTKHDFNIAQFPIKFSEFSKFFKDEVKRKGVFSAHEVVERAIGKFVSNNFAKNTYGIAPKENESKRTSSLKQAYGIDKESKSGCSFQPPQIRMTEQVCLSRDKVSSDGKSDKKGKPIYRVHIYDAASTASPLTEDVCNSFATGFGLAKMVRDVTDEHKAITTAGANVVVSSVNHQGKYDKDVQTLIKQGVLTQITNPKAIEKLAEETKQDKGKLTTALESFLFVQLVDPDGN